MKRIIPLWLSIFMVAIVCFISVLVYSAGQMNTASVKEYMLLGERSDIADLEVSVWFITWNDAQYEVSIPCVDVETASGKYTNYEWNKELSTVAPNNSIVFLTSSGLSEQYQRETIDTYSFPLMLSFWHNKTWLKERVDQDYIPFWNVPFPYITTDEPEYYLEENRDRGEGYYSNDKIISFQTNLRCVELNGKEYFTINNTNFDGPYEGKSGIFGILTPKKNKTDSYEPYIKLIYEVPISSESTKKVIDIIAWEEENAIGVLYVENTYDLMLDFYSLEEDKVIESGKLTTLDFPYEKMKAEENALAFYTNENYLCMRYKEQVQVFDYYDMNGELITTVSYGTCKERIPELSKSDYPSDIYFDNGGVYFLVSSIDENYALSNKVLYLISMENEEVVSCVKYDIEVPFYKMDRKNNGFRSSSIIDCQIN